MHNNQPSFGKIIFPLGHGGNHLRWLLFLDQKFPNTFGGVSKLDFIRKSVYAHDRSWNSWLAVEWKFRTILDPHMTVSHDCWDWEQPTAAKELYLTVENINQPLSHYFHINLGCNNLSPSSLKAQMSAWSNEFEFLTKRINEFPNKKIIKCDRLFDPALDYDFYKEVVDFFGFDDNYHDAVQVHNMYHQCRVQSVEKFVKFFKSNGFAQILDSYQTHGEIKNIDLDNLPES